MTYAVKQAIQPSHKDLYQVQETSKFFFYHLQFLLDVKPIQNLYYVIYLIEKKMFSPIKQLFIANAII